jgi:hypothetical protein
MYTRDIEYMNETIISTNIVLVRLWAYDPILVIPLSPLIHMA